VVVRPQVVSGVVDPVAQRGPLSQQRLVGDLHGRTARHRVAIETQQAVSPERVEHPLHPAAIVQLLYLSDEGAPSSLAATAVLIEADQSEQHVSGRLGGVRTKTAKERIRPPGQCSRHATALAVGGEGDRAAGSGLEQLRQRVLQQRQGARSIDDLAHNLRHDEWLDIYADPAGWADDGCFELVDRHRRDHLGPVAEQLAETPMAQWTVVEVGPQRDHDADAGARRGDDVDEPVDETSRRVLVDLGEQLLELVDHQQELAVVVGQEAMDRPPHTARRQEQVDQRVRGFGRDTNEGRLQLLEGMRRRCHVDAEPLRRHGQGALRQRGQQPGAHHARLAATTRPHDSNESSPGAGFTEPGDEPLDDAFPPEEVPGIGGTKGAQPLVRVLDRGVVEQRRSWGAERVGQRPAERRRVRVPPCRIGGRGPIEHRPHGW
jgi:hypothetical protein